MEKEAAKTVKGKEEILLGGDGQAAGVKKVQAADTVAAGEKKVEAADAVADDQKKVETAAAVADDQKKVETAAAVTEQKKVETAAAVTEQKENNLGADAVLRAGKMMVPVDRSPDQLVMSLLATFAPSKTAYRFEGLSRAHVGITKTSVFLMGHLAPRRFVHGDACVVFQPTGAGEGISYTHVAVEKIQPDLNNPCVYNFPVKETEDGGALSSYPLPVPVASPAPAVLSPSFFAGTLPALDAVLIGAHGRLLLGRSNNKYIVGNPADDRLVMVPLPPVTQRLHDTTAGLCYEEAEAGKLIVFKVVQVLHLDGGLILDVFDSKSAAWERKECSEPAAAEHLPAASPGVFAGHSMYWLSKIPGKLICLDTVNWKFTLLDEPAAAHPWRLGRSLGSAGGRLRFASYDHGGELSYDDLGVLHVQQVDATLSVWTLTQPGEGWFMAYQVPMVATWAYKRFSGMEFPLDFPCAREEIVLVKKDHAVFARHLGTGELVLLTNLFYGEMSFYGEKKGRGNLYQSYNVFPFFE